MRKLFILVAMCALVGLLTASTYTINVPSTIDWYTFTTAGDYTNTGNSITISTDDPYMHTCSITVRDTNAASTGFLTLGGADDVSKELSNALTITGGDLWPSYFSLTTERTLRASTTLIGDANITDFAVSQTITSGDLSKTAGTYSLIMTFTATFSP